ncbi:MAG: hypothetical protein QXJ17_02660 [Nitrososphaeria archaeon]
MSYTHTSICPLEAFTISFALCRLALNSNASNSSMNVFWSTISILGKLIPTQFSTLF